jgi:hypothetical protein
LLIAVVKGGKEDFVQGMWVRKKKIFLLFIQVLSWGSVIRDKLAR